MLYTIIGAEGIKRFVLFFCQVWAEKFPRGDFTPYKPYG
jgi:hypothetical protein